MLRISQILYQERRRQGLTLEEISKATKIRTSFLSAIEKGDYHTLPSPAYAQGFVSNYATYLGLPAKEITAKFRREYAGTKDYKVLPESLSRKKIIPIRRIRFGFSGLLVLIPIVLLLLYVIFQFRYLVLPPPLEVITPGEGERFASKTITVSGKTDPNGAFTLNNEPVPLDSNGNFEKKITVFPGDVVLQFSIQNRFGKKTIIERHIYVNSQ